MTQKPRLQPLDESTYNILTTKNEENFNSQLKFNLFFPYTKYYLRLVKNEPAQLLFRNYLTECTIFNCEDSGTTSTTSRGQRKPIWKFSLYAEHAQSAALKANPSAS